MQMQDFDTRQWWIAMVIFAGGFLGAAIAAKDRNLVTIALGLAAFAFGEWRNHPLQTSVGPGWQTTSYPRRFTVFGTVLQLIGIGLLVIGLWRYLS